MGQPLADCDFNLAGLHPAYPIKRRTSAERTQASPERRHPEESPALDPLENNIRKNRTFRDGVADRLNSSSATPPGQAKTPPPICVVHWMSMSSFDIRCKILMYPMRGSRWYDTKRRPASCLRPPTRNPRRDARICRRPCPRLRQDQPIRLVFDIITATAFIETGV
jgi:hypothetical protein